jgi:hypothetical protein
VLLEVTIAELNRTEMELRGVDFHKIGGSVRAGYWLGGGERPASRSSSGRRRAPGIPPALPP